MFQGLWRGVAREMRFFAGAMRQAAISRRVAAVLGPDISFWVLMGSVGSGCGARFRLALGVGAPSKYCFDCGRTHRAAHLCRVWLLLLYINYSNSKSIGRRHPIGPQRLALWS